MGTERTQTISRFTAAAVATALSAAISFADGTTPDIPGPASEVYELSVNGTPVKVVSFKDIHYAQCTAVKDAAVEVRVKRGGVSSARVQPSAFGIKPSIESSTVRFTVPRPMQIVVQIDFLEKLFLFIEPPSETPPTGAVNALSAGAVADGVTDNTAALQSAIDALPAGGTILIPAGHFRSGSLRLKSEMTLFLASGALLQAIDDITKILPVPGGKIQIAFLAADGVTNLTIAGHGTIDANGYIIRKAFEKAENVKKKAGRILIVKNGKNVAIRGVTVRDSYSWNIHCMFIDGLTIRGVKILSDVRLSNHDGFDIESSSNVLVENSFAFTEDDGITPKARVGWNIIENHTYRNMVIWAHKANAIRVGTESACTTMRNFIFENIYILNGADAIRMDTTEGAVYDNFTFRNIWIEDLLQYYDERYERNKERKPIDPSRVFYFWVSRTKDAKSGEYSPLGRIKNIRFENITISDDRILSRIDVSEAVTKFALESGATPLIENITFSNIVRGAKPISSPDEIGFSAPLEKYGKLVANIIVTK
ncbi:MAG: glycosyl hydrolase family 28 protein [Spirochaetota bacterium]